MARSVSTALAGAVVLFTLSRVAATPVAFYLSPSGSDSSGDGSINNPWLTVPRAQAAVRAALPTQTGDIWVYLRGGSYFVAGTLTFTPDDSGANGFSVQYASYPGDATAAHIHGGVPFSGWTLYDATHNIWSAPLDIPTRQVYINGDRASRTLQLSGLPGTVTVTASGYETTDTSLLTWAQSQTISDVELLYTGVGSTWTECRCRIAAVAPLASGSGTNITMAQPCWYNGVNKFFGQGIGANCARIENVLAHLAQPGQHYLDSGKGVVYYIPRPGVDNMENATSFAAATEVLLTMQGDRSAQPAILPVHHIAFTGIVFEMATWLDPSTGDGYINMQSGFRVLNVSAGSNDTLWAPVPGNIQLHTVANVSFTACVFQHLGMTAVVIDEGSQSVVVANCTFRDVSCGGVRVGQVNDWDTEDPTRQNAHHTIFNNAFQYIPVEYHDCAPLLGGFVVNTSFVHNSIESPPNTGISMGWGWGRDVSPSSHDNHILANYIHNSNTLLEDGGSIYTLGPQPNSTLAYNYVYNQTQLFGSLYHDEGSAYWHTHHNVVNGGPEWLHIWTPSIHDIIVEFCWTNQPYMDEHGTNITMRNNTILAAGQAFPPEAQAIMLAAGVLPQGE